MKKVHYVLFAALLIVSSVAIAQLPSRVATKALNVAGDNELGLVANTPKRNAPVTKAVGDVYNVPVTWSIGSQADFDEFTTIDANGDAQGDYWYAWYFDDDQYWPDGYARYYDLFGTNNADDWLITPGVKLEAGKRYYIDFHVIGGAQIPASGKHTFDITAGPAPTVEGQSIVVQENIGVPRNADAALADIITFSPTESGTYFIGFHLNSDAKQGNIYLNNITVKEGESPSVPGAVTNLSVTPDATGALAAELKFDAPMLNIGGEDLAEDGIDGVRIERETRGADDKKEIASLDASKGESLTYTDDAIESANYYTYTITPFSNANGDGDPVVETVYVGLDTPYQPQNVALTQTDEGVKLTWDASQAYHGGVFFPEQVTYTIYNALNNEVGSVTGTTEWNHEVNIYTGNQGYLYYYVVAENAAGKSDASNNSNALLAGAPYEAPVSENFAGGTTKYLFEKLIVTDINNITYNNQMQYVQPVIVNDELSESGYATQMTVYIDDDVYYGFGMISLASTEAPRFTFKARNVDAKDANSDIIARVYTASGAKKDLYVAKVGDLATDAYKQFKVDLSEFKSEQFVKVGVIYSANNMNDYLLNRQHINVADFYVGDIVATDLAVDLYAPARITTGETAKLTVVVTNNGDEDANGFTVKLTANGNEVGSVTEQDALASFATKTYDFDLAVSAIEEADNFAIVAEATIDGDANLDNNSADATVAITKSEAATPLEFAAVENKNEKTVELTWQTPPAVLDITDGFENYTPWAVEGFGNWTTADLDASANGTWVTVNDGTNVFNLDYPREGEAFAWMVTPTNDYSGINLTGSQYAAYEGNQCLVSVYGVKNNKYADLDDWLISPELTGEAQDITFYIFGLPFDEDYPQKYRVLYSTGDNSTGSFTAIDGIRTASNNVWEEITVSLPEGTKYFAIQNYTDGSDAYVIMLDNISYQVNNDEIVGYNVYRNGELIATVETPGYTDVPSRDVEPSDARLKAVDTNDLTYAVTAVYANGKESQPVTASLVISDNTRTAITNIAGDKVNASKAVYSIDGRLISRDGNTDNLPQGIYIIGGKKVVK